MNDTETYIENYDQLDNQKKRQLKKWLNQLCVNSDDFRLYDSAFRRCNQKLETAINNQDILVFYKQYFIYGKRKWEKLFRASKKRKDMKWSDQNKETLTIPFKKPTKQKVWDFVKNNVEDEFQWNGWQLQLLPSNLSNIPYIRFLKGVTPNVSFPNIITMNSDASLDEYSTQWTIRHEFGHVLGFPDCYIEFYDSDEKAIVNYQLDTSHLMCSRTGKMNAQLYNEIMRSYP